MKKIILIALAMVLCFNINAQEVSRNGNTFTVISNRTSNRDTIVTKYQFSDSKGNTYPIICIKNTGHCYIWRKSSKTGKMYKMYFSGKNESIAKTVAKELGIKYIESTKKSAKK
jgi:predicted DNA binding protein